MLRTKDSFLYTQPKRKITKYISATNVEKFHCVLCEYLFLDIHELCAFILQFLRVSVDILKTSIILRLIYINIVLVVFAILQLELYSVQLFDILLSSSLYYILHTTQNKNYFLVGILITKNTSL